ncbi:MAG: hypothetical protein WD845_05325 [Pirellulales bacterium]
MSPEIWLRTNSRALWFGMVPPAIVAVAGLLMMVGLPDRVPATWMRAMGLVLLAAGGCLVVLLAAQLRRPRLAYCDGELLVWLNPGPPVRMPIESVECFWLGQAPSLLPGKQNQQTEAASLVIRVAEAASDWHHKEVKPRLGAWCSGYITIRGTWCEPLNISLVNQLNQRLAEATRSTASKRPD